MQGFTQPNRGRYVRHIDGADFSLEANTESVPLANRYYLLQAGKVLLDSKDFTVVEAAYKNMCRDYWLTRLTSTERSVRMASAWGLLGIDINDRVAGEVIAQDGTVIDCRRAESLRNRKRAEIRTAAEKARRAAAR